MFTNPVQQLHSLRRVSSVQGVLFGKEQIRRWHTTRYLLGVENHHQLNG